MSPDLGFVPAWDQQGPGEQQPQSVLSGFSSLSPAGVHGLFLILWQNPLKQLHNFESMFKETAKSVCLDRKNVTFRTVAYGDNFHITVIEGAYVNATVQLQETVTA